MKRDKVESSTGILEVKNLEAGNGNGGVYEYFDVTRDVYEELREADSHGSYFYHNMREDYEYEKIKSDSHIDIFIKR